MLEVIVIIAVILAVAIALVLILAASKPDTFRVDACRCDQGGAGNDLPADRRLSCVEEVVALGRPRSRDETHLQRC